MNPSKNGNSGSGAQQLEDVPELIHEIQSWLSVKEGARTSVLSKSWLHAWSTTPTLEFHVRRGKSMKLTDIDRTLVRYLRDNIPIETFDLKIDIENQESASHVEKLIGSMASKTSLKEISLNISVEGASFMLPDEILAGENLTKITVSAPRSVWMTTNHVINCCGTLRKLHLYGVCITEKVLHDILSSCRLLEDIELLDCCKGFKTIKVKNLPRLYKLRVSIKEDDGHSTTLEVSDVPNLAVFSYDLYPWLRSQKHVIPFSAHSISLGSSRVTQLTLCGVITDNACLDKIKSGFPFLESLTLGMRSWMLGTFNFTCASIKKLSLRLCPHSLIDIQVDAPKLVFFEFCGRTLPSLLFAVSSLKQLRLSLWLHSDLPVDANFFLRMREALTLSCEFHLRIYAKNSKLPLGIDIDVLRKRLVFPPATNVQELWFETDKDECQWERSPFFDAFFEICHPKYVYARPDSRFEHKNYFCRLMMKEVLEKKNKTGTAY